MGIKIGGVSHIFLQKKNYFGFSQLKVALDKTCNFSYGSLNNKTRHWSFQSEKAQNSLLCHRG